MKRGCSLLCPEKGLIRRCAKLKVVPGFEGLEERPEPANGAEADEGIVNEIRRNVPRFQFDWKRLREIEFAASEHVPAIAGDGEGKVSGPRNADIRVGGGGSSDIRVGG